LQSAGCHKNTLIVVGVAAAVCRKNANALPLWPFPQALGLSEARHKKKADKA